ncbi:MAG: ribonuclease P protein component [Pseudomonadota bacterium]
MHADEAVAVSGFRRQHRLLKPAEFANVFAARRVLRGSQFALHYRDSDLPVARLGLVIPKKQAHTAVLRNAIKRQAREIFRLRLASLPARDVVLRLTRLVETQDKPAWRTEITQLLERLVQT